MRAWERHADLRLIGEWHVHTSHTDGANTVDQMCQAAARSRIPLIAFTEHVRRTLDYDFHALLEEIDGARHDHDITIISGCETKVLPDGSLDVSEEVLEIVDCPIFAYHGFPRDKEVFLRSLHAVIESERAHTWAHPGTFTARTGIDLSKEELEEVMSLMARHRVALEINTKYLTPDAAWIDLARRAGVALVRGSDAHSTEDLEGRDKRWREMGLSL